jgi:2-keto-4-pentenoate hydratase/2-oxohepta-3-ene-1,7-dioic acid hydratase in catechol pathway
MIDVSACGEGRRTWKIGSWLGKSFDTFAPIGPCIATIDESPDRNNVHVQFWVDGQLRHNYNTDEMEHLVPELVEFAIAIMTLNSATSSPAAPTTKVSDRCRTGRWWPSTFTALDG